MDREMDITGFLRLNSMLVLGTVALAAHGFRFQTGVDILVAVHFMLMALVAMAAACVSGLGRRAWIGGLIQTLVVACAAAASDEAFTFELSNHGVALIVGAVGSATLAFLAWREIAGQKASLLATARVDALVTLAGYALVILCLVRDTTAGFSEIVGEELTEEELAKEACEDAVSKTGFQTIASVTNLSVAIITIAVMLGGLSCAQRLECWDGEAWPLRWLRIGTCARLLLLIVAFLPVAVKPCQAFFTPLMAACGIAFLLSNSTAIVVVLDKDPLASVHLTFGQESREPQEPKPEDAVAPVGPEHVL